ncbi:MAG: hypothetical protein RL152_1145 [Bacteroidota bacterium]|jgi:hypothetical protein
MKNYTNKHYSSNRLNLDIKNMYTRLLDTNSPAIDKFCQEHKYIYRYLPFERFLEVLHKKQLAFISPIKWNDLFEIYW